LAGLEFNPAQHLFQGRGDVRARKPHRDIGLQEADLVPAIIAGAIGPYGVVAPGVTRGNIIEVKGMVEKPKTEKAPSRLCIVGRYILPPEIFGELDKKEIGAGGEIQLTDSMQRLIGRVPFHAVRTNCARYDCGDKVGFLQANIAVGLARPDIAPALKKVLGEVKL
jgi:UTP--glucose-1-phosphate uridylyltransferase